MQNNLRNYAKNFASLHLCGNQLQRIPIYRRLRLCQPTRPHRRRHPRLTKHHQPHTTQKN